ncbi:MAG: hypothetical protein ACYDHP_00685 [Ferrimicrobium sp.]
MPHWNYLLLFYTESTAVVGWICYRAGRVGTKAATKLKRSSAEVTK